MAEIESLEIKLEATSANAANKVDALSSAFERLKGTVKGGAGLTTVTKQMQSLATAANALNGTSTQKLRDVIDSLQGLSSLPRISSGSIARQLTNLANGFQTLNNVSIDQSRIQQIGEALRSLSTIERATGLNSAINALRRLPEISAQLDGMDLTRFAQQMRSVADAMRPLADEMARVSAGFAAFPARIQRLIQQYNRLEGANSRVGRSFRLLNLGATYVLFRRIASAMGGWLSESNAYVENLNLFNVAMGEYAESAREYAEQVGSIMGIDPSTWMRNQGVFMTLATGFGIVSDKAELMSKNLTQLGYDLSSFFNISVDEAMQKLQSGISGELEPLRRLGYDLSQARLQAIAMANGIDQSVASMTQAEKAQLRYIAIMTQVTTAQGDMSRTLESPANQLRIFQAAITQTARALGNILIPALNAILPYLIGFVNAVQWAAQQLANLLGFSLPSVDYSGVKELASYGSDAEDALTGAGGAAKELKRQLMGIDELTVLQEPSSGGGGGGADGLGDGFALDLPEYDFLGDAVAGKAQQIAEALKPILSNILELVGGIAAGLASWRIASALVPDLNTVSKLLGSLMVAVGVTLLIDAIKDIIIDKKLTWGNVLKGGGGGAIAGGGLGLMFAKKLGLKWKGGMLTGAVLGVGISLMVMGITDMAVNKNIDIGSILTTAIGAVLTGGALGGIGLSKLGFFTGEGIVIGASVVLSLTLTAVNFSAISSGKWDSGSWKSVLMGALSTVAAGVGGYVLAGAVLGSAAGPVGAVIGIGVGLVINLVSASIAEDSARQLMVENTFYDEQGVLIADLTGAYADLISQLGAAKDPIIEAWKAIASGDTAITNTANNINQMIWELQNGAEVTPEYVEKITSELNSIYDKTVTQLTKERDLIYAALAGSLGDAVVAAGGYVPEYVATVGAIYNDTSVALETLKQEMDTALSDGDWDTFYSKWEEYSRYVGETDISVSELKTSLDGLNLSDIDWGDPETRAQSFEDMSTAIDTAKESAEEAYLAAKETLEKWAEFAVSPEQKAALEEMITFNEEAFETKVGEIESVASEYLGSLQTNLISSVEDQVNAAMESWDSLSWFTRTFKYKGNQDAYIKEALEDYEANIVQPVTEQMKSAFTDAMGEDSVWADTAMSNLIDSLFTTYTTSSLGGTGAVPVSVTLFAGNVADTVQSELDKHMKDSGVSSGDALMGGMATGIEDNASVATGAAKTAATDTTDALNDALQINSPSKITIESGLGIMEGLAQGMEDNITLVQTAVENVVAGSGGIITALDSALEESVDSGKTAGKSLVDGLVSGVKANAKLATGSATELIAGNPGVLSSLKSSLETKIIPIGASIPKEIVDGLNQTSEDAYTAMKTFGIKLIDSINEGILAQRAVVRDSLANLFTGVNIRVPTFSLSGEFDLKQQKVPRVNVSWYASGGFPEQGEMFIAREAGPELVGRIGNRAAVANNDQIVKGIAAGVEVANEDVVNAVMAIGSMIVKAIQDNSGTPVYVDGREVTKSQNYANRMYGRTQQNV